MMVALISPAQAAGKIQNQIDVGYFSCWQHADGVTWQNIPGFGVKKPGDTVTFSYTVTYDGPASDQVTGVKDVSFYQGDAGIYGTTFRQGWQPYNIYDELYGDFIVTRMEEPQFVYKGNKQVNITITVELKTKQMHGDPPNWGKQIKEAWQSKLTDGRKFFTPVLIEWELEGNTLPDFFVTKQPLSNWPGKYAGTYSGRAKSKIIIPARVGNSGEAYGNTDFAASWWGNGWEMDKLVYYKNNIGLNPGQIVDVPFEVTVPRQGEENRLVVVTNLNYIVPELNYNNNSW